MAESRRLRTQAERDADGTTWRAGDAAHPNQTPAFRVDVDRPISSDELEQFIDRFTAAAAGRPFWLTATIRPPRRRWWHRYTRRNP